MAQIPIIGAAGKPVRYAYLENENLKFEFEYYERTEGEGDYEIIHTVAPQDFGSIATKFGLDPNLDILTVVQQISDSFKIPIIISGGVGRWTHALNAMEIENVTGICTSNIYHLTTSTILSWRKQIIENGGNVREL